MNRTNTMEKLKTPKSGYSKGRLEAVLKITRDNISTKRIPAALVKLSLKISRNIFNCALLVKTCPVYDRANTLLTYQLVPAI
jgi:hypothetical protein